ncbi:hypothetical protein JAAARDRAFT_400692 [Jaapia argillacea MUCL 33604]|uniref:Uncharacterized protein n=1 Tax=Jaapia argillacea MUCL 33604 TaxID=933084 RepID=A0A067PLD5_9AGAM|nr:hypothetical protein JAAARDRAFT_400692 [Jaapia argillacea MUCL 33604]
MGRGNYSFRSWRHCQNGDCSPLHANQRLPPQGKGQQYNEPYPYIPGDTTQGYYTSQISGLIKESWTPERGHEGQNPGTSVGGRRT